MEINTSGYSAREVAANRAGVEQELTQRAQEKDESLQKEQKVLEPRPVEQTSNDKQGRIDIYV